MSASRAAEAGKALRARNMVGEMGICAAGLMRREMSICCARVCEMAGGLANREDIYFRTDDPQV